MSSRAARPRSSAQDRDACGLAAFLAMLVGRQRGGLLEVRARRAHGGMAQRFYPAGCLRGAAAELLALGVRTDVYVGCAPRLRRAGDATALGRVWTLWVDCDDAAAVGRLAAFTPAPAVVVRSGSATNVHAYWPLLRPLVPGEAGEANRQLAAALGACTSAVTNPAAVLRAPGTHNFKHDPPAVVALARFSPARRFVAAEVIGALPEPPARRAPRLSRRAVEPRSASDPLLRIAPAIYVQVLTGQEVGRDRKVSCPLHEDRVPSLHVYEEPEQGWYCFGCRRGGSIYDLAAELFNVVPRGRGFVQLRAVLSERFAAWAAHAGK